MNDRSPSHQSNHGLVPRSRLCLVPTKRGYRKKQPKLPIMRLRENVGSLFWEHGNAIGNGRGISDDEEPRRSADVATIGSNGPVIVSADILLCRKSRRRSNLPPGGASQYGIQRTHGRTGTSREASLPMWRVHIGDTSVLISG